MGPLFDHYTRASGRYDELTSEDGQLRPQWNYLAGALANLDHSSLAERQNEIQRLLLESGITYNRYDGDQVKSRAWPMDLLPLVITSREWREVEVGVAQRAELLRALMHDIYGPQTLIRQGLLPPELIYAHNGYLLPCSSAGVALEEQLVVYGADLGRDPNGRIWVTGDRTQAPSGIGYTLAARTVSSRVLPSVFRESNVHPVLPFLRDLRTRLVQLAEDELDQIAILTPGSANEAFTEHAYLARHLGLPLVEGADLQVTGGRCVHVAENKQQTISVLLRRQDDDYCDPLELNRRSLLGIPGGLQAVRNRKLKFANPLGSGVLENPALMAFLPQICRYLLGEELKLPSQDTWWCGRKADFDQVKANWENMIIRTFQPNRKNPALAVCRLSENAKRSLLERVRAKPSKYVAQTINAQAIVPVLSGQNVAGYPAEWRTFAVSAQGGFRVMTGGLARVGRQQDSWRFSSQLGGVSKDIWVLASEQQRYSQTLPQFLPRLHSETSHFQPHVFEKLLWLGRYIARADLLARMLRTSFERLAGSSPGVPDEITTTLTQAITWQCTLYPGFVGPMGADNRADPVPELLRICASERAGGLRHDIAAIAQSAEVLRDLLGQEVFKILTKLDTKALDIVDLHSGREVADRSLTQLTSLQGLLWRTLTEDRARSMIEIGMALEQALGTVRLVRSFAIDCITPLANTAALLFDLTNTPMGLSPEVEESPEINILRNLLLSNHNAQSLRYQLMVLERLLRSLQASKRSDSLASEVATHLSLLGSWDLDRKLSAEALARELKARLADTDKWLGDIAIRIEQRYSPRRPLPQTQLIEVA